METAYEGPFGVWISLHSRQEKLRYNPTLEKEMRDLYGRTAYQITAYGIGSVSTIGLLFNGLVFWIWNSKGGFQPIIFAFEALAVFDGMYILAFNVWYYCQTNTAIDYVLGGLQLGTQYMVVNTTLLAVACGWLAAYRPALARTLPTLPRLRMAVGAVVGWCLVVATVELLVRHTMHGTLGLVLNVALAQLAISVPLLVQVALAVSLVWRLRGHKVNPARAAAISGQPRVSTHHHSSDRKKLRRERHLGYTAMCLAAMSFVAYPAGLVAVYHIKVSDHDDSVKGTVLSIVTLMRITNSSVKFLVYFTFVLKFRKLMVVKFFSEYTSFYHSLADTGTLASDAHTDMRHQSSTHVQLSVSARCEDRGLAVIMEDPEKSDFDQHTTASHRGSTSDRSTADKAR